MSTSTTEKIIVNGSDHEDYDNEGVLQLKDVVPKLDKPWYRYSWLRKLNFYLFGSILCQITSGFDGSMMNGLQTLPSWKKYFGTPTGATLGTMSNGIPIGVLISIPILFFLIDYIGRKRTIVIGAVLVVIGAAIQAAAQNIAMFTTARVLIGFGSGFCSVAAGPILSETAYPSHRPAITALCASSWAVGSFIAAVVTWGPYKSSMKYNDWSWRLPSLLQGAMPLLQIPIVLLGPESPRWLISKGREEEARKFFVEYHGGGDENSELVTFELAEIKTILSQEQSQITNKFSEWFKSKQRLRRLFVVCAIPAMTQLCGNAIVSYYLTLILNNIGITNPSSQLSINLGLTIYSVFIAVITSLFFDRFKRKTVLITGFFFMCGAFSIWTALSAVSAESGYKNKSASSGVVAFVYLFQGFYHLITPVALPYAMEICPYHLRAQGASLYNLTGNAFVFFNNYLSPIALGKIGWKYYIVWVVWLLVQATIVYFVFPETKGLGLEEIAMVFGEDVTSGLAAGDNAISHKTLEDNPHKIKTENVEYASEGSSYKAQ